LLLFRLRQSGDNLRANLDSKESIPMHRIVLASLGIGLLYWPAAALAGDGVAKFRVVDVKLAGNEATVEVAWEYAGGTSFKDKGKGVQFYVQPGAAPGYNNGKKDCPVGTVDMTDGNGMATLKVDIAKLNVKAGDQLTMWAFWPDTNHQWGVDKDRPGGEFTLPAAQNSSLAGRRPLWLPAAAAARGWRAPMFSGQALRGPRLSGLRAPWVHNPAQNSRLGAQRVVAPRAAIRGYSAGR
jgi:hypothetical protein